MLGDIDKKSGNEYCVKAPKGNEFYKRSNPYDQVSTPNVGPRFVTSKPRVSKQS